VTGLVLCGAILIGGTCLALQSGSSAGSIRKLAQRGASEHEMIAEVQRHEAPYALSAEEVIALHREKVPDAVIIAMLKHKR